MDTTTPYYTRTRIERCAAGWMMAVPHRLLLERSISVRYRANDRQCAEGTGGAISLYRHGDSAGTCSIICRRHPVWLCAAFIHRRREMGDGRREMGDGDGRWEVGGGRRNIHGRFQSFNPIKQSPYRPEAAGRTQFPYKTISARRPHSGMLLSPAAVRDYPL